MPHVYRCPECRTRKFSFTDMRAHERKSGHKLCTCGGYHYAHRRGSPCCEENPRGLLAVAERAGATQEQLAELEIELLGNTCPF